jgi:hypothetical protein
MLKPRKSFPSMSIKKMTMKTNKKNPAKTSRTSEEGFMMQLTSCWQQT